MVVDYSQLSDAELLSQARSSRDAMGELIARHTRLVRACARPLFLAGGDREDLVQEGMIGLVEAIRGYDPQSGAAFPAFAALCIRRRMISAVRAASARKHAPLNESLSIRELPDGGGIPVPATSDPEEELLLRESAREFTQALQARLSPGEQAVLERYLEGFSYQEIARRLGKTEKAVDNAIQRIRRKAAHILGENGTTV